MELTDEQLQQINVLACGILMTLTICMSLLKRHQLCAVLRSGYSSVVSFCCNSQLQLSKLDRQTQEAFQLELSQLLVRAGHGIVVLLFCRSILVVVGLEGFLVPSLHLPALLLYAGALFGIEFKSLLRPSTIDCWAFLFFSIQFIPLFTDETNVSLARTLPVRLLLSVTVRHGALSAAWNVLFYVTVTIKSRLSNKSTTILDASGGGGFSEMVLIMSVAFVVRQVLYRHVRMSLKLKTSTVELSAVSRLLHGFCDAVVELDEDLNLTDARQLSTILLHRTATVDRPSEGRANFLSYFSSEDVPRVRDCLERPGQNLPPLALNAKMIDSMASEVHVELLHVPFSNAERKGCHYVGMREIQDTLSAVAPLQCDLTKPSRPRAMCSAGPSIIFLGTTLQVIDAETEIGELCQKHMSRSIFDLTLMDLEGYEAKSAKSLSSQVQHAVNGFMHGCAWAQQAIPLQDLSLFGRPVVAMTIDQETELLGCLILSEPTSFLTQRNVRRLERCSSHHGRCSRRGAASYGGSSRGSPSEASESSTLGRKVARGKTRL